MSAINPVMPTYAPQPVAFERGEGAWLFDTDGRRYLDCLSGIAVNTLGHNHPKLVAAICDQASKIMHCSNLFEIPLRQKLAERLVELSGMSNVFFCNSGLEANEAAIKLARLYGHNRGIEMPEIVVYEHAFHGRSLATLSATGNVKVQKGFEPLVPGFVRVPLNDMPALDAVAAQRPNVVAVFLEAVQGEGGIQPARIEYLRQVRELCDRKGWLLMIDEVQCGTGRTGRWFAHQWAGIPVGAIVAHGEAAHTFKPGNHGTTFGGNPLAMRAGLTTIEVMEEDGLIENATLMGQLIMDGMRRELAGVPGFVEVRGMGLMIGIVLDRPCSEVVGMALKAGLVLNVTADTVVRLLPPLIINREQAELTVSTLAPLIREVLSRPLQQAA